MVTAKASMYYFYNWKTNSCCLKNIENIPPENMGPSWYAQLNALWFFNFLKKFNSIWRNNYLLCPNTVHCAMVQSSMGHHLTCLKILTLVKETENHSAADCKNCLNKVWKSGGRTDKGNFILELSLEDRVRIHHSKKVKDNQAWRYLFPLLLMYLIIYLYQYRSWIFIYINIDHGYLFYILCYNPYLCVCVCRCAFFAQ